MPELNITKQTGRPGIDGLIKLAEVSVQQLYLSGLLSAGTYNPGRELNEKHQHDDPERETHGCKSKKGICLFFPHVIGKNEVILYCLQHKENNDQGEVSRKKIIVCGPEIFPVRFSKISSLIEYVRK